MRKYLVKQIMDRFQNEIVSGNHETEIEIDNGELELGDQFWSNDISNGGYSGMYEVIGIVV